MCLSFFVFGLPAPQPLFFLAFNRDEYMNRPTQPLHLWGGSNGTAALRGGADVHARFTIAQASTPPTADTSATTTTTTTDGTTTAAAAASGCSIIGGRDLEGGGTWLGVSSDGRRVAWLTNLRQRDPIAPTGFGAHPTHASRGELITRFLLGQQAPLDFVKVLDVDTYYGFNLVVGDLVTGSFAYCNNAPEEQHGATDGGNGGRIRELQPGVVYGLSNGLLMEWPKVTTGVEMLRQLLPAMTCHAVPYDRIFGELLGDAQRLVPPPPLPPSQAPEQRDVLPPLPPSQQSTGGPQLAASNERTTTQGEGAAGPAHAAATAGDAACAPGANGGLDTTTVEGMTLLLEHVTSGRFVSEIPSPYGPSYGTRSQTVVTVWHDGEGEARERHRGEDGQWHEVAVPFRLLRGGLQSGTGGQDA